MPSASSSRSLAAVRFAPALGLGGISLTIALGMWLGLAAGLLAGAALALLLVISLFWQSLQHMSGDTELSFDEALTLAAPTAEEEQKRAVLRALKDLEYERSVGKISEADFHDLSARYRADAKRLILMLDSTLQERRKTAEELLEARLAEAAPADAAPPTDEHGAPADAAPPTDEHGAPADAAPPTDEHGAPADAAPSTDAAPQHTVHEEEKAP